MQLNIFNIDDICDTLPEITDSKPFTNGKFSPEGLYSEKIFGPIKSYYCACNRSTYHGRNSGVTKCDRCGVEITSSNERRNRYGRIKIPFQIFNPLFYYMVCMSKATYKTKLLDILLYRKDWYYNDSLEIVLSTPDNPAPDPSKILKGLDGAKEVVRALIETNIDKPEVKYMADNIDKIAISNVLVIPPDFRPCGKTSSGQTQADTINNLYIGIMKFTNTLNASSFTLTKDMDVYITGFKNTQIAVMKLFDHILSKMSKKSGLIRSNILGKRLDFSGRAVISPDPTLKLTQCRIPYWMMLEMLKPQFSAYLVNRRKCKRYNQAVKMIDDSIKLKSTDLFELAGEFCKGKKCILNRQPTLHRLGMLAFDMGIHLGNTIQIHPLICSPFNSDFDGDQMAVYVPITPRSYDDVVSKVAIENNLISMTDMNIVPTPNQDIILGLYSLTKE